MPLLTCLSENVHAEVYSRLVQELIQDVDEQDRLFSGLEKMPTVRAKADWCLKWIESPNVEFAVRLIAFAIVEGVFFSSSFAAVFWLRQRGIMHGLVQANTMIARDEGMHMSFACLLYRELRVPVDVAVVHAMLSEAVALEHAFFNGEWAYACVRGLEANARTTAALPRPLLGMNSRMMKAYVEYVADFLLKMLGFRVLFRTDNPVSL